MDDDELVQRFELHRGHLYGVAHRLLGSVQDAEDAVQDSWLRLQHSAADGIDNLGGWLTTVTSRICLDKLRARRARPETALDRPDIDVLAPTEPARAGLVPDDPASHAVVADSVGRALVVVLDALSPAERVAFVLHDVFAVPFDEIAPILDRSTEATKKLAGRARRRVRPDARPAAGPPDLDGRREVIGRFLDAVRRGDMTALLDVLAPDAVRTVDPVLLAPGRPATTRGARSIVEEARSFSAPARRARPATIDGRPGAVVTRAGGTALALTFTVADGRIERFEVIADPRRLARLAIVDHL